MSRQKAYAAEAGTEAPAFSWDNANVYFVMTDRFYDGDSGNNNSYGRPSVDATGFDIGTFHGGDLKGLTQKLNEGYFTELGTNAIWITAPYEQIHGWVGGGSGGDFAHYAYHGYYALDYTMMDKNMGTVEEMRQFVDTAHAMDIRVVLDVVLNHPGYSTLQDMEEYGFGARNGIDADWTPGSGQTWHSYHDNINYNDEAAWSTWWSDWVRAGIAGYESGGGSDLTMNVGSLPDFRTNVTSDIGLAPLLQTKWASETSGYDDWILPAAEGLREDLNMAPADYIVKWLAAWVEEFGIDGFRADTAKHVELSRWAQLKEECSTALQTWRQNNPDKPGADWTGDFWMTGEVWGHGVGKSEYFNYGFDSVINFSFQDANFDSLESIYADYASKLNGDPDFNVLSYISSHDTRLYDRSKLVKAGTALLLLPGAVQTFYGDEAARAFGTTGSDPQQGTRSSMDWDNLDQAVLSHWQKLGQFRNNHLSVGAGSHAKISDSPYTFSRTYSKDGIDDSVVVVTGAAGSTNVDVSSIFPDGTIVRDAYTGEEVAVSDGSAAFTAGSAGVILIELVAESELPYVSATPAGAGFRTDTQLITLKLKKADIGYYSLDGSDPRTGTGFTNGTEIIIGEDMEYGESVTLKLYAENDKGTATQEYKFTRKDPDSGLTIHYKKPSNWGAPYLYYYDTAPEVTEPAWAASPAMVQENGEWYVYTISGADSARVMFRDSGGNQNPGRNQAGFLRSAEGWYDGTSWYDYNPDGEGDVTAPTAPENLTSAGVTDKTVALAWDAATDDIAVTGYNIYRDGVKVGTAPGTAYTDTGLTAETTYVYTVRAYDAANNESPDSEPLEITTEQADPGNTVTVYYKHGYTTPYMHYRPEGGTWTTVPGVAMEASEVPGYSKLTVDIGTASRLEACFNNGSGQWDSNNGKNYFFNAGTWTYNGSGQIVEGAPDPAASNKVTVYYKQGYGTPYMHFRPEGGAWTVVPGVAMEASEVPGYSKLTVDIGTASRLEACFNNGSGQWDSNNGRNYFFGVGTWTYSSYGNIVSGVPSASASAAHGNLSPTAA
ncbi:carbohydrate binding domain-containing protein [Paenibacillus sp. M1]|uniref:Carbohydrate binding domain-containing protein n=2 Tax=Paenibacillus haidiansis TaxID=1574488 RepID=A0ABU7VY80_9BACL